MQRFIFLINSFLVLSTMIFTPVEANDPPKTGSLIVTYQTNSNGERLDRIRFWIKNDHHKQSLYPKGKAYVDDLIESTRMVVIEDLEPGQYTLEFLVPNTDGFFAEMPDRKVVIAKGDVVKIDQIIKPRSVLQEYTVEEEEEVEEEFVLESSSEPESDFCMIEKECVEEELEDFVCGTLIVSFDTDWSHEEIEKVRVKLRNEKGVETTHPIANKDMEVPLDSGKMIMMHDVPVGDYSIEFFIEGESHSLDSSLDHVAVEENKTRSVHQCLSHQETE